MSRLVFDETLPCSLEEVVENTLEVSDVLGYLAGVVLIIGYVIYNGKIFTGKIEPNTATWTLWVCVVGLNAFSYDSMSGDRVKAVVTIASGVACFVTFLFALVLGKFQKLNLWEKRVLAVGLLAICMWGISGEASYANLLLQFAIGISFIPLFRSVRLNPKSEQWLPWVVWVIAYGISITTVILRWNGHWLDLAYPINGFVLHGVVALLTQRR